MRVRKPVYLLSALSVVTLCGAAPVTLADTGGGSAFDRVSSLFNGLLIPQMRTSGNLGYSFYTSKSGKEDRNFRHVLNGTVFATSYIWQPWLATTDANLTVSEVKSIYGGQSVDSGILTGSLSVYVLPQSHFPTSLTYRRTNSATKSSLTESKSTSDSLNLFSRVYWDKTLSVLTSLDYATSTQSESGGQTDAGFSMSINKIIGEHDVTLRLSHRGRTSAGGMNATETASSDAASARYRYTPWEDVMYDSTSTILLTNSTTSAEKVDKTFIQGTSTLRWTPEEYPFSLSAVWTGLNEKNQTAFVDPSSTAGDTSNRRESLNGALGLNYKITRKLLADANVGAAYDTRHVTKTSSSDASASASSEPSTTMRANEAAGLSYTDDMVEVYGFDWNWTSTLRAQSIQQTAAQLTHNETFSLGQSARKELENLFLAPVKWSLSQGIQSSYSSTSTLLTTNIGHRTSLTYQSTKGGKWTIVDFSATDNRVISVEQNTTQQLYNMQLTKGFETDQKRTWSADLSIQLTHGADSKRAWRKSSQGSVSYHAKNVYGVRGLSFQSQVSFLSDNLIPITFANTKSSADNDVNWSRQWNSTMSYRIGLVVLQARLQLLQDQSRHLADSFQFSVVRSF